MRSQNSSDIIAIKATEAVLLNIVLLLEKIVCLWNRGLYFISAMIRGTLSKIPHLKISNGLKMMTIFLGPCQGKLAGGIQFHGCSGMTSLQTF